MQNWQKIAMGMGGLAVLLLAISNVMLYQLLQDSQEEVAVKENRIAVVPDFPAPGSGSTSKELLKELDRTQQQIQQPLDQALFSLDSLGSTATTLEDLRGQFNQVAATTEEFSEAAPELRSAAKRTKSMQKQFKQVTEFVYGLGPIFTDLTKTLQQVATDVSAIKKCSESSTQCR